MDIARLSTQVNPDAAGLREQPVAGPPIPAGPVLKQGEIHDSSLVLSHPDEESASLASSAPVVRSQTEVAPGRLPTLPLGAVYVVAGAKNLFETVRYDDGNGEVDYDIEAIVDALASGKLTDVTAYPELVLYKCFVRYQEWYQSSYNQQIFRLLKNAIASDEYKLRVLVSEVRIENEPALAALNRVYGLQLKTPGLVGLAYLLAEVDGVGVARHFEEFGVTDPQERFNIALASLKANPSEVPGLLGNFELTSLQRLQLALAMPKTAARDVCKNLENYVGFANSDHTFAILMDCVRQAGAFVAEFFPAELAGSDRAFELAMKCTQRSAWEVAQHFQKFGITDQKQIEKLAQACALANGEATAQYVKNFGLTNLQFIRQLGIICAGQNGMAARYFSNFGVDDLDYKMRFAMACARSDGYSTAAFLKDFGFSDDASTRAFLWRLALVCANQNGATVQSITNFGIVDPDQLYQLALKCFKNGAQGRASYFEVLFPGLFPLDGGKIDSVNFGGTTKQIVTSC